ncbi:hypothetical protein C8R43DRAFT_1163344, partial [Mycena crocata]
FRHCYPSLVVCSYSQQSRVTPPIDLNEKNTVSFPRMEFSVYELLSINAGETKGTSDDAILRAVDSKHADFFPKATRRLYLSTFSLHFFGTRLKSPWSAAELARVLSACTGVRDIMIIGDIVETPILSLIAAMRPMRVSMFANISFAKGFIDFGAPFFSRVTHLHLGDMDDVIHPDWPSCSTLACLPTLTHFAAHCKGLAALLPRLLAALQNLVVLIAYTEGTVLQHIKTPDIRLVEWASGGEDSRSRADEFIARKRFLLSSDAGVGGTGITFSWVAAKGRNLGANTNSAKSKDFQDSKASTGSGRIRGKGGA